MNIVSLFDGCGMAYVALKKLGIKVDKYYASEIDEPAIKVARHNHPDIIHLGDVKDIDFTKLGEIDLLIGGSPCFKAGTLITTSDGLKVIEEIKEGDLVLTHKNRFRKVLKIMVNKTERINSIKIQGSYNTFATPEHPYYVRTMKRQWNNSLRRAERIFSEPYWKKAKDLSKNDFVGIGVNTESRNINNLTLEECWLLGRYIADGYIINNKRTSRVNSYNHKVVFCIGKNKIQGFKNNILTYHIGYNEQETAFKCVLINKRFMELCLSCGKGAENKSIPGFILDLPIDLLKKFLDGYMSGDGCYTNNKFKGTSISKKLILQLGQVITKVYKVPYSVYETQRKKTTVIEGRTVNQKNTYEIAFQKEIKKQNQAVFIDGILWQPFRKCELFQEIADVYNFEVEEDNSYVANNCIVHNCTDLSISKANREGLKGERSGLFYEYVRALKELKPKYFLLENVASMANSERDKISEILGVNCILINSALLSAQQRKRYYWTNISDIKQPEDKHICLKDILESGDSDRLKSYCIDANYYKGASLEQYLTKSRRQLVFDSPDRIGSINKGSQGDRIYSVNGKSVSLSANGGGRGAKTGLYLVNIPDGDYVVRKLTPLECERLMTLSDGYTFIGTYLTKSGKEKQIVSASQQYKMIGNGFTVDVIAWILSHMPELENYKSKE